MQLDWDCIALAFLYTMMGVNHVGLYDTYVVNIFLYIIWYADKSLTLAMLDREPFITLFKRCAPSS